ncbi:hypothetical protein BATDEDRAFT_89707 [Batrachochytrium dendrobatidis JAM81]|uniref:Uncharacterized protein n=1 Tax=Batrachochytrium dendrobatidis (strain JAM81 / FGSC 10211) TaxID=684364 RepID=F4P6A4_BATDJ|nr:uncharacterized protein BATDEDRAFT_89707 [Batrachochytrium dendrobatidis JAM81]EGF79573.1 hypothetical protein BATDEDRAFT_89707 [Batrachochytrium dendrobatidis JAM81]KAK5665664.1 hypothetical protein QVD99_007313 [Batrachochytrium dendrobatidis]|eukprot:XP_006680208.1 hypothetical protein BATDEDRAFT_89707 [Batrachochytrium dendrobatidis JAM81]
MSSSLLAGRTPKQFFSIGILLVSIAALTYLAITTRDYGPKFLKRRKGRTGKAANLKKKKSRGPSRIPGSARKITPRLRMFRF